jgi:hypothetical protein
MDVDRANASIQHRSVQHGAGGIEGCAWRIHWDRRHDGQHCGGRRGGRRPRKKIDARAAQLIAREMILRELRPAHKLTHFRVAKAPGISQDGFPVSKSAAIFLLSMDRVSRGLAAAMAAILFP